MRRGEEEWCERDGRFGKEEGGCGIMTSFFKDMFN